MNIINNSTNSLIQTGLSASMTRQNTIAQNIANVDTPNYKAKKTLFSHELDRASSHTNLQAHRTDERHSHFGGVTNSEAARVVQQNNTMYNHNGNNVDIDKEMAELAQNQIYYNALIDRMNGRFNSVRTVLGQGG
ncbi:flagellar basal body rod protein FlgB [Evansella halocellulosilytica]|uniref:flagellar basal body rod protein FlgB n=1 Tax=Evansella halocellulosilytica TaxID=2011013 RepID=UPI000BB8A1E7|nr:flagellar basal body rod protein FlgB [Evansella halocellulosilytica]